MADATYRLRGTNSVGPAVSIDFIADDGSSDANAKTIGQSFSTLMGCNVDVFDAEGVYIDSYTPGSQGTTVSSPSGVSVASAI